MENKARLITQTVFCISLLIILQSQQCSENGFNGPNTAEDREVGGFNAVEVSDGIDVYLTMDNTGNLKVEAGEGIIRDLVTRVEGNTLKIYFRKSFNIVNKAKVYVSAKALNRVETSGGSELHGRDPIEADRLTVRASGGSDISIAVKVAYLEIGGSGGADISISGESEEMSANASGGSDLNAFDLIVRKAEVESSGGSDLRIHVLDQLSAHASGGSDIYYKGDPKRIRSETMSSSDIHHVH